MRKIHSLSIFWAEIDWDFGVFWVAGCRERHEVVIYRAYARHCHFDATPSEDSPVIILMILW